MFSLDKYYLVDVVYSHTRGFMAPYKYIGYWFSNFHNGGRAKGKEEKFSHAYARL